MNLLNILPPDWGSYHVLVIHFPIALLSVVPLFILLGLFLKNKTFLLTALILLGLGTGLILLAISTGEASSEQITPQSVAAETLNRHDDLAQQSRTWFVSLTFILAALTLWEYGRLPRLSLRPPRLFFAGFLLLYAYSVGLLVNTAYHGALLVHHHGIHSALHNAREASQSPKNK